MTTRPAATPVAFVRPDSSRIIVPRKHGQVLVEPALGVLVEALREAGKNLENDVKVGGVVISELRAAARREFLAGIDEYVKATGLDGTWAGRPCHAEDRWIFTGHQVEFYH